MFCYETDYLCRYRFEKLESFLSNHGNLLMTPSAKMLLYSTLVFLSKNPGKIPRLIDFGGACGESIILLSSIFGEEIFKSSWVIESPEQAKASRKYKFSSKVQFQSDLESVLENEKVDIFFTSCAIHYLKSPYEPLKIIARKKVPFVCLTRNNFSLSPSYYAQVTNISENGTGVHLSTFDDREIWYPTSSIKESKVKEIFASQNYIVSFQESGTQSGVIDKRTGYSNDICFSIKTFD